MYWTLRRLVHRHHEATNRYAKIYREGKLPFVVNQGIWFEGETRFADVILPACTNFER